MHAQVYLADDVDMHTGNDKNSRFPHLRKEALVVQW